MIDLVIFSTSITPATILTLLTYRNLTIVRLVLLPELTNRLGSTCNQKD